VNIGDNYFHKLSWDTLVFDLGFGAREDADRMGSVQYFRGTSPVRLLLCWGSFWEVPEDGLSSVGHLGCSLW
jgi:hypothetical protein